MALVYRLVAGQCVGIVFGLPFDSIGAEVISCKPFVSGVSLAL